MTKMNLINEMSLNRNITAVLSTMKYSELKNAIREGNIEALTALKGIGIKTAEKIIATGRDLLAPSKVHFHIPHYSAPMFNFKQMLTKEQFDLLKEASESTNAKDMLKPLRNLASSLEMTYGPLVCNDEPEYNALPFSMLSRLLNITENESTNALCIVKFPLEARDFIPENLINQMNRYQRTEVNDIFKSLEKNIRTRAVEFGFVTKHGVKYRYYTCSSGQLKKQSGYWMEESKFKQHQMLFWGLLTPKKINNNCMDKNGVVKGIPMTKILQYRALLTSSAIPSSEVFGKPIKLRNLICVHETQKMMTADVMSVSSDYKITEGVRDDIENNMFDGMAVFNSERIGWTMAQLRGFGIKGLGVPADWHGYCESKGYIDNKDCWMITDVDGVVHDLRKETNIYGIVDTSVFKMLKMFGSWKYYVECMEELEMDELYICSINEESTETKRLSRQMMQSLFAVTDNELEYMANDSLRVLFDYSNIECATNIMGETDRKYDMRSNLGKLVSVYPDMLAESCVQKELKDRYIKQYNSAMCGELNVNGRYFFVAADPCAWMDIMFGKKAANDPEIGWLRSGECYCDAYTDAKQLIALRSPHAFMEWAVLYQAKQNPFVMSSAIYTSVHDLTFRILQMDYDGDHLLVVDDEKLISIVENIKDKYQIPVVYYEPSSAPNPGPMPTDAHAFAKLICECIENCAEYNKVGQYSNLVTAAWSTYAPDMNEAELRSLLRDVAVIAAGINHAVDAQKTYSLNFLEDWAEDLVKSYKFKPFNERFKNATLTKPNSDPSWDKETTPKASGSVDRLGDIVKMFADDHLELDVSSLNFNWKMLQRHEEQYNIRIQRACASKELVDSVKRLYDSDHEEDRKLIARMQAGESVSFNEFVTLIKFLNNAFFVNYRETEDDEVDIKLTHLQRIEIMRNMIVDFVRIGTEKAAGLTDEEILITAANSILKETYNARKYQSGVRDLRRFIFDTFGDLYAEAVLLNIAEAYVPEEDEYEEPPFNPDVMDIPPMTGANCFFGYEEGYAPEHPEDLDAFLNDAMTNF